MGDSLPPPASFDLVGSFARCQGAQLELVIAEPKVETAETPVITLRNGSRSVDASGQYEDWPHGRRLVVRAPRSQLTDGIWSLTLSAGGNTERLDARLLVQGERPLVLLWGAQGNSSLIPLGRPDGRRQAAAVAGRGLDRALSVLPDEQAKKIRARARTVARRVLH